MSVAPALFLTITLLSACRREPPPDSRSPSDASPTLVSNSPSDSSRWIVDSYPLLLLGENAGPAASGFVDPIVLRRLDGILVVADREARSIRAFDSHGKVVWEVGRRGSGPGEFEAILSMHLMSGDSLFVHDGVLSRATVLSPPGKLARIISFEPSHVPVGLLNDSTLLLDLRASRPPLGSPGQTVLTTSVLAIANLEGRILSRIGEFPRSEVVINAAGWRSPLFGRSAKAGTGQNRFVFGFNAAPEVGIYSAAGTRIRRIRWRQVPALVEPADVQLELAAQKEAARIRGIPIGERNLNGASVTAPEPVAVDTLPFFSRLRVDPQGAIWVEQHTTRGVQHQWFVFDSTGTWKTTLAMPEGFDLHQVGNDFVAGVLTVDDMSRPAVFRLDRPGPMGIGTQTQLQFEKLPPGVLIPPEGNGYSLAKPRGSLLTPQGELFLIESSDATILHFGRDGRFLGKFGGPGSGPGEFRNPSSLTIRGDSVIVWDYGTARQTMFTFHGKLVRPLPVRGSGRGMILWDGRLATVSERDYGPRGDVTQRKFVIITRDNLGSPRDTIAVQEESYRVFVVPAGAGMVVGTQPFDDSPLIAVSQDGAQLVRVDQSKLGRIQLTFHDTRTGRSFAKELPVQPVRITQQHIAKVVENRTHPGMDPGRVREALYVPQYLPAVSIAFFLPDGKLVLRSADTFDGPYRYDILSSDGQAWMTITLPRNISLVSGYGSRLVFAEQDSLGLPSYRIVDVASLPQAP